MDGYPKDLAPRDSETGIDKEPFRAWWLRVHRHFLNVPSNVARQWLHRHWNYSDFCFLPSQGSLFELKVWSLDDIEKLSIWRTKISEYVEWGHHLLQTNSKGDEFSYPVANIMARHGTWPAPIIVLNHDGRFKTDYTYDLPIGPVLIEGNRRTAIALALASEGRLAEHHKVWLLSYSS